MPASCSNSDLCNCLRQGRRPAAAIGILLAVLLCHASCARAAAVLPTTAFFQPGTQTAPEQADVATDSGDQAGQALRNRSYPWYDSAKDDLRRLNVKPPAPQWQVSGFSQIMGISFLLLLLLLLAYFLYVLFSNREDAVTLVENQYEQAISEADRIEALPIQARKDVGDFLSEARRHYEQGNFREAVIYLYSHQLLSLDRHHLIRLAKGKTNRQYLREITRSGRRALGEILEQTLLAFEDVFFGDRDLPRDRFEACWQRLGEFDRLLEQPV